MEWTNEDVIQAKTELFASGDYALLDLFPKQREAMALLASETLDELLFGGAAGGGKSFTGCEWLLWNCLAYPETRWFIGRKHLSEIRKSTIVTFNKVCRKHKIPAASWKYNDQSVRIVFDNGSVIEGLELMEKPGDKDFDNFGSTEYTGGWIEEAGGIPYKAYETLKTRVGRHYNDRYGIKAKILITCNPSRNWLYQTFYLPFRNGTLPPDMAFVQSFATDNTKRESGYLERLQTLKGEARARLLIGDWEYDDDPLSLIDWDAIQDIYTNDYIRADETDKRLICDVAMYGSDLFRLGVFYGDVLVEHDFMPKSGGRQIVARIKAMQAKHNIRAGRVLYDADGVGAFIGGGGGFLPGSIAFHGGAAPIKKAKKHGEKEEPTEYYNLKSQCAYLLAEKVNDGLIWAAAVKKTEDRELLSEELSQVKRDKAVTDGKLKLMAKEQIIKNIGRSPDFSDLFLMNQWFDLEKATSRQFKRRVSSIN